MNKRDVVLAFCKKLVRAIRSADRLEIENLRAELRSQKIFSKENISLEKSGSTPLAIMVEETIADDNANEDPIPTVLIRFNIADTELNDVCLTEFIAAVLLGVAHKPIPQP